MTLTQGRPVKLEPWQDPEVPPYVRIRSVTKKFEDFVAVDDVSLDIYRGEFFALLGASGSGKTTLLRLLAGFEQPSAGTLSIDGMDVTRMPPYERPVSMMFQSYALFPHMTVARNVAFGLHQDRVPRTEIRERVARMLDLVQLTRFSRRKPHQLSGGQRQRVALARSLVKRPKLLLLDEPLAALDRQLRERTQFELVNIQEKLGMTFVIVTHDQEEAMTMASRIAVMNNGYIVQVGTPTEVYEYPNSRFVAEFVGSVNLLEGRVAETARDHIVIETPEAGCTVFIDHGADVVPGATVWLALRPEKVSLTKLDASAEASALPRNRTSGVVKEIAYLGSVSTYLIALESGKMMRVTAPNISRMTELPITWDDRVALTWRPGAGVVLTE